jgi:hypothetical protein
MIGSGQRLALIQPQEEPPLKVDLPGVRRKIRTREHVLADLSINHVERQI